MKKTLALLLTLIMAFSLLTACGGAKEEAQPEPEKQEEEVKEESSVKTVILKEEDDDMKNTYTLIAVAESAPFVDENGNPVSDVKINTTGAKCLIAWLLSKEGKDLCAKYGEEEYGQPLFSIIEDGPSFEGEIAKATDETKKIRLSTTTSVNDSGLLGAILPVFEDKYGYEVEVQSAGTGLAIAAAEAGNADLILVHAKAKEEEFVAKGFAYVPELFETERLSFMYNYFVLCGPEEDPAKVADAATVKDAFAAIAEGKHKFISRGDGSGTHTKELSLWPEDLGITEDPESFADYTDWYISANAGMGACLVMAEEQGAYILTDKATYLTFMNNGEKIE